MVVVFDNSVMSRTGSAPAEILSQTQHCGSYEEDDIVFDPLSLADLKRPYCGSDGDEGTDVELDLDSDDDGRPTSTKLFSVAMRLAAKKKKRMASGGDRPHPTDLKLSPRPEKSGPEIGSPQKEKTANSSTATSPAPATTPTKKTVKLSSTKFHWVSAVAKAMAMEDPWSKFDLELPTENAKRYRYSALRGEWVEEMVVVKMENTAFGNGAMRECFRLKKLSNFSQSGDWHRLSNNFVAKRYLSPVERDVYFNDVKLQMDAKLWGEEYNRHNPPKKVDIFQMSILEFVDRQDRPLYHLEHYIHGKYIKYNSNSGFVDEAQRHTPQAFSHFTFERSGHELIIVDIQGVGDLYTDPQIHTASGEGYGDGNLGTRGMALFFHTHVCNAICKSLRLTPFDLSNKEMELLSTQVTRLRDSRTRLRTNSIDVCHSPTGEERERLQEYLRTRAPSLSSTSALQACHLPQGHLPHSQQLGLHSIHSVGCFPVARTRSSPSESSALLPGISLIFGSGFPVGGRNHSESLSSFDQLSISPPESPSARMHHDSAVGFDENVSDELVAVDEDETEDEDEDNERRNESASEMKRGVRQDSGYGSASALRSQFPPFPSSGSITSDMFPHPSRSRQSSGASSVFGCGRDRARTVSECSGSSTTLGTENERFLFQEMIRMNSRPSNMAAEKEREEGEASILGQIHLDLAKYHEVGRFNKDPSSEEYDENSALFHLTVAADLGVMEAVLTMARIFLGLPHDILTDYTVEDGPENVDLGLGYLERAAALGDRNSMIALAQRLDTGIGTGTVEGKKWDIAMNWYDRAMRMQLEEEDGAYDGHNEHPSYLLMSRQAEMYKEGGNGLGKDPQKAGDLFSAAADAAMAAGKGRLANKWYQLAEEAWAEVEEEEEEGDA